MTNDDFINNLKQLIKSKKMKRKELALQLNVTTYIVDNWLCGRRQVTTDIIYELCDFFDVTPNQIFGYQELPKKCNGQNSAKKNIDRCLNCTYPQEICNGNTAECDKRAEAFYEGRFRNGRIYKK